LITVDAREPESLRRLCAAIGFHVEPLEIGDFAFPDYSGKTITVERKTYSDLQSSVVDGRITNLAAVDYLLLEGPPRGGEILHIIPALLSIQNSGTKVVVSTGMPMTPFAVMQIYEWHQKSEHHLLEPRGHRSGLAAELSVLCALPGVGPKRARVLIDKFGSISGIMSATESELATVVPRKVATDIKRILK